MICLLKNLSRFYKGALLGILFTATLGCEVSLAAGRPPDVDLMFTIKLPPQLPDLDVFFQKSPVCAIDDKIVKCHHSTEKFLVIEYRPLSTGGSEHLLEVTTDDASSNLTFKLGLDSSGAPTECSLINNEFSARQLNGRHLQGTTSTATAEISGGSNQVDGLSTLKIIVDPAYQLLGGSCQVRLRIPDDFQNIQSTIENLYIQDGQGLKKSSRFFVSEDQVVISDACGETSEIGTIWLGLLQNPTSVRDTQEFSLTIGDSDPIIFHLSGETFSAGSIYKFDAVASNPVVQEASSLSLTIWPSHKLSSSAGLIVELPPELQLTDSCQAEPISFSNLRPTMACQIEVNKLLLEDLFYSYGYDPVLDREIKILFKDLITRNPPSAGESAPFVISSFDVGLVDQGVFEVPNFNQPGQLQDLKYEFSSGTSNSLTDVRITFKPQHRMASSTVQVTLPSDFELSPSSKCQVSGSTLADSNCSIISDHEVDIRVPQTVQPGGLVSLKVTAVKMPRYQGFTSDELQVVTVDEDGDIDAASSTVFVADVQILDSCVMESTNKVNSQETSLVFSMSDPHQQVALLATDMAVVKVPSDLQVTQLICFVQGVEKPCSREEHDKIVIRDIHGVADSTSSRWTLTVTGVVNPETTRPMEGFKFHIVDFNQRFLLVSETEMQLRSLQASNLEVTLEQSNTTPLEAATFTFSTNGMEVSGWLMLSTPDCMPIPLTSSLKATDQDGLQLETKKVSQNQLSIITRFSTTKIVVHGLYNPSESCWAQEESLLTLEVFLDASLEFVQSETSFKPSLGCIGNCGGCLPDRKDICTSCPDGFALLGGSCTETCPQGTLLNTATKSCLKCDENCLSCSGSMDFCLSCTNQTLIANEGVCVEKLQQTQQLVEIEEKEASSTREADSSVFGQIPLLYASVALLVILLLAKSTCVKQLDLLMALATVWCSLEMVSLICVLILSMLEMASNDSVTSSKTGDIMLFIMIVVALLSNMSLNAYVGYQHRKILSTCQSLSAYQLWVKESLWPRFITYLSTWVLTFHSLTWFNCVGQFDPHLTHELYQKGFTALYTKATKLSLGLPKVLLLVAGVSYGIVAPVENSLLQARLLECCLLTLVNMFLLLIALNFTWKDKMEQPNDSRRSHLYKVKNSIDLHVLRSQIKSPMGPSRVNETDITMFDSNQTVEQSASMQAQARSVVKPHTKAVSFFMQPRSSHESTSGKNRSPLVVKKSNLISEQPTEDMNFNFFARVKRSIESARKIKTQSMAASERTVKTQRHQLPPMEHTIKEDEPPIPVSFQSSAEGETDQTQQTQEASVRDFSPMSARVQNHQQKLVSQVVVPSSFQKQPLDFSSPQKSKRSQRPPQRAFQ